MKTLVSFINESAIVNEEKGSSEMPKAADFFKKNFKQIKTALDGIDGDTFDPELCEFLCKMNAPAFDRLFSEVKKYFKGMTDEDGEPYATAQLFANYFYAVLCEMDEDERDPEGVMQKWIDTMRSDGYDPDENF